MRTIDALKVFETIWAICNGGPGTASEVLNVYLYAQAFAYNQVGTASAGVVVFFAIIVALSLVLLWARQKAKWCDHRARGPPFHVDRERLARSSS